MALRSTSENHVFLRHAVKYIDGNKFAGESLV